MNKDATIKPAHSLDQPDPELAQRMRAAGYERLMTLGCWKALDGLAWDALGECLVVRFRAGRPGGERDLALDWEIPRALAVDLLSQLQQAFSEKASEVRPMQ